MKPRSNIHLTSYLEGGKFIMWKIRRTDEVKEWIHLISAEAKQAILAHLLILQEFGPTLGRPYVDTIKMGHLNHLKELRVQNKGSVYRIFFIFNSKREAILLIGGDKKGNKNFYKNMIPLAEKIYETYLKEQKE